MAETGTVSRARGARTRSVDVADALLRAADVVLRRDGWEGLSARVVAAEAGVARMGIYSRFGSMDGLIDALLIRGWDDLAAASSVRAAKDPYERLLDGGRRYRAWALANREYYEAMFLTARSFGSAEVTEHAMAAFGVLIANVEYAMAGGVLAQGDACEVSQLLLNAVHGAVTFELKSVVLTGDAEANYEQMLAVLARGLGPA